MFVKYNKKIDKRACAHAFIINSNPDTLTIVDDLTIWFVVLFVFYCLPLNSQNVCAGQYMALKIYSMVKWLN
jgi:hypothetical protein